VVAVPELDVIVTLEVPTALTVPLWSSPCGAPPLGAGRDVDDGPVALEPVAAVAVEALLLTGAAPAAEDMAA
jgi:hypothetical protein